MKPKKASRILALITLSLFAGAASAHTGVHSTLTGFAGGLVHPFLGLDHLFAMIAIGLWAGQQGGRTLWAIPAAFVGAMLAGGMLAWSGWALPQNETAIALSVLVLGVLVATRRQWALPVGIALAAGFALFHGYAHGLEMPRAAAPGLYALGFVLATACLHGVGIVVSLIGRRAAQVAGAGIAATGLALMFAL
jgi:urease accessory protein